MSVTRAIKSRHRRRSPLALLEGKVFISEHGAFDRVRRPWNLAVDQHPAAVSPEMYLNFAETRREPGAMWAEPTHRRLRQIKGRVDPDDLIRSNHPIAPA
jgi:hypothetical protein